MNRICDILNIQYPIVQAPMAWITSPELVAAVSNAGGLGILGPNAGSDEVKITIEETKELTDKPFAVNYLYIPGEHCQLQALFPKQFLSLLWLLVLS